MNKSFVEEICLCLYTLCGPIATLKTYRKPSNCCLLYRCIMHLEELPTQSHLDLIFIQKNRHFCRRPSWMIASYLAPVLQYGTGLCCDFLVKMLGIYAPLFLCNTHCYFLCSLLLLHKSCKSRPPYILRNSRVGTVFPYNAANPSLIP